MSAPMDQDAPENDSMNESYIADQLQNETIQDDDDALETAAAPMTMERDASSSVLVAVRVRPLLAMEDGTDLCLRVVQHQQQQSISSLQVSGGGPRFTYDQVFDLTSTQHQIYSACVAPLVESCLMGYNATIFAYGQTGSGKTYTIMGDEGSETVAGDSQHAGVIPRAIQALFDRLNNDEKTSVIRLQFLEIYGEEIRDLLTSNHCVKLSIRDVGTDGEPEVLGATQKQVSTATEALRALTHGKLRRVTGATAMNEASSRSHAILSVLIEQSVVLDEGDAQGNNEHVQIKRSKFNFIDLAGAERQKRTQAEGKRLKEGIDINKGLLVLGNVISALGDPKQRGKTHVPYRDSKLTRLLKGSLGGNHKTLMIACVSPSSSNLDETLNCLRYANRAKNIQNHAVVNMDASSKLVAELQNSIQVLATDLLKCWDEDKVKLQFTRQELRALASGESTSLASAMSPQKAMPPATPGAYSAPTTDSKLEDIQLELDRTREQLRETRVNHDTAEEQLYVAKAQSELLKLQLSVVSPDGNVSLSAEQAAFLEKSKSYEAEIGELKAALRDAESKANKMAWATVDVEQEQLALERARKALEADRERLASLKSTLSADDQSSPEAIEREEIEEQSKIHKLTEKYLSGNESFEDHEELDAGGENDEEEQEVMESPAKRHRLLETGLSELSRSIAAKEDLIEQLRLSHEKYAGMKDFYDERLRQMESTLSAKEAEREKLLLELQKTKEGHRSHTNLTTQLKEKEGHIADLRKKQKELRNLTAVSSRNLAEINRLQNDVTAMKRKKVDMQKQLVEERKSFANEKKQFQKDAMQKDRELNKWKQVSNQREIEKEKAQQVAKARLQELGHLRSKYKDAEKKVRVLSLKKGVMAKAGLDPILVGRREKRQDEASSRSRNVDVDRLRDHFDQKVASVVRKEAIVDKLAEEWEEHFQLTSDREAAVATYGEGSEEVESLSIQIKFKESRIRQLAQRLGRDKQPVRDTNDLSSSNSDNFLFDGDLARIFGGSIDNHSKIIVARVLFGMIVRERRRVSVLARTASSLDERAQIAEKAAAGNEAALQSYMEEQRQEIASLTQAQREQIISLMGIVKETSEIGATQPTGSDDRIAPNVLLLANEQISLLEQQIEELRSENQSIDNYRAQVAELNSLNVQKSTLYDEQQEDLAHHRAVLRQIRELTATQLDGASDFRTTFHTICELVDDILHARHSVTASKALRRQFGTGRSKHRLFSPRLKKHVELMHTSDSDGGSEPVDWSSEIMADLAIIAEGRVPPSLKGTSYEYEDFSLAPVAGEQLSSPPSPIKRSGNSPNRGSANRRAMTKQVTEKLSKIVVRNDIGKNGVRALSNASRKPPKNPDVRHKSVFDRLGSPSHYTVSRSTHVAAQKEKDRASRELDSLLQSDNEKEHDHHAPHSSNYGRTDPRDAATRLLDDLLVSDSDAGLSASDRDSPKGHADTCSGKLASYTQQDVFERLQKTTTQAYAVKQLEAIAYDTKEISSSRNAISKEPSLPVVPPLSTALSNASGYIEQDVFERLQTTTTEAYAKKKNPPSQLMSKN
ncbi:hypothetical protein MPSEU_000923000 [Mayamaea pseudoterrestris]|nr:hypothetical protein MPSEU_000923000 [Mayamaea pseudoterrestris]